MLEGEVDTTTSFVATVTKLQARIDELQEDLEAAKLERDQAKKEAARAVAGLRKTLNPLYHSLKVLYGEMEGIGGEESAEAPKANTKWEAVKQRLAPRMREAVDIFLAQGAMKRTQLASAMRMDYTNCNKNVVQALIRQGLLLDNGKELSLKEL